MLRLLWACLRWDDMAVKPSAAVGTTRTGRTPPHSPSTCLRCSLFWREGPTKQMTPIGEINCFKLMTFHLMDAPWDVFTWAFLPLFERKTGQKGSRVSFGCHRFYVGVHSLHFSGFPPHHHTNPALSPLIATETSDTEITTTEIIKRRDVGPYGIRSEYCIRKIICPLGVPETPKGEGAFFFHSWHCGEHFKKRSFQLLCKQKPHSAKLNVWIQYFPISCVSPSPVGNIILLMMTGISNNKPKRSN